MEDSHYPTICIAKDWSLITGRGSIQNGRGACEVLPLRKGWPEKVLAMLKGDTTSFVVVFMRSLNLYPY